MMRIALLLHVIAVIFWVGGMAFVTWALRPSLATIRDAPQRLMLLHAIVRRFFAGVTLAIVVIFASGIAMMIGLPGPARGAVHAMAALGVVMAAVYAYLRLRTYRMLDGAIGREDWAAAGRAAGTMRRLVELNLGIAVAIIVVFFLAG